MHGAYELYARKYQDVQSNAESSTNDAYRSLAQKGVLALEALQSREVPFFLHVDDADGRFAIERAVPERLTFAASMSDADRQAATAAWNKAREHIQTDYEEIRRLDWAMTTLLRQLQRIRRAIDEGEVEQFRLVKELAQADEGKVPFELPYQVTKDDYFRIVDLLLLGLEEDRRRLQIIERDIVAVGLVSRATDAGSGSLAANIRKVLLAVVTDSDATEPRSATYPAAPDERDRRLASARELAKRIKASPEFARWSKAEDAKKFEQLGSFLTILDSITGLPTSAIYRQVISVWKGEGDYLSHLRALAHLVPGGGQVAKVLDEAIDTTEKARKIASTAIRVAQSGVPSPDALVREGVLRAQAEASRVDARLKGEGAAVLNTATQFGRSRLDRQLAFFQGQDEIASVAEQLSQTRLMRLEMPRIPAASPAATE